MRTYLWDVPVDTYSREEVFRMINQAIAEKTFKQIVTLNLEILSTALVDKQFKQILKDSFLVIPDGKWITYLLRMRKKIKSAHLPGIFLMEETLKNNRDIKVFILGASEKAVEKAVDNLKIMNNNNEYIYHHGYFELEEAIISLINETNPDILLVGMGSPKQEKFIYTNQERVSCLSIGIGGSIDVWSGFSKRAPAVWTNSGFEWLYRLLKEPRRILRIVKVIGILWKSLIFRGLP